MEDIDNYFIRTFCSQYLSNPSPSGIKRAEFVLCGYKQNPDVYNYLKTLIKTEKRLLKQKSRGVFKNINVFERSLYEI